MTTTSHISGLLISIAFVVACNPMVNEYEADILQFQDELNRFYSNPETSPLKTDELEEFKGKGGHSFFPIDSNFKVKAELLRYNLPDTVLMPTSSEKVKVFLKRYKAHFRFNGQDYDLALYQNTQLMNDPEYKNHIFLPFKDMTSGQETYGGGRYIDLKMPEGNSIVIDFNKAYHPYCAYTEGYSCPIPPSDNYLKLPIKAGIKLSTVH